MVTQVTTGIAHVRGLPRAGYDELLEFPDKLFGLALNLDEDEIGVVLLGDYAGLQAGDEVRRTGRVMDIAVGDALLGRVIDPLGRPLDGGAAIHTSERLPIERPAPARVQDLRMLNALSRRRGLRGAGGHARRTGGETR